MENVSQPSPCDALHHAFRWLIAFYINAVLYFFYYWGAIRVYRHCVFSNTRLRCTYSKLCRVPLGHTLVQHGAGLPQVAALMSTFMSVGITTLPMEQKIFGRSFAYARNAAALLMSLLFSYIIWMVMV